MVKKDEISNWSAINSRMIAVSLTILTLLWALQSPVSQIASCSLIASFLLFLYSTTVNSKLLGLIQGGEPLKEKNGDISVKLGGHAEYSFGFGLSLLIGSFSFLAYQYIGILGVMTIFATAWSLMLTYHWSFGCSSRGRPRVHKKVWLWFSIEAIYAILIGLDVMGKINIS